MVTFFMCLALLILGFLIYGRVVEKIFVPEDSRDTPALTMADGVDYVKMPNYKVFLIQLLNIAGVGPIYGPILGALYGPIALVWVVAGCILGGAVHDYFSGMLSIRNKGASVPGVIGAYMGNFAYNFMNVLSLVLLILVGVVFVLGPAKLLVQLSGWPTWILIVAIFIYYILATLVPIDKIIGRLYPFFGALLLFMAFGLIISLLTSKHGMYASGLEFRAYNTGGLPAWPMLFITLSCGAVSGFHATQSPLMARCIGDEKSGRKIFYGAMICEGIIGLIWVTLGMSFYESADALQAVVKSGGPSGVVYEISNSLLGKVGGIIAVLGVIVLPITSGDTAFRSARLIIADKLKLDQKPLMKRLYIGVPMFVLAFFICAIPFGVVWRYFGFANQSTAAMMLWAGAIYLGINGKFHWICSLPATFMTAVVLCFIMQAKIGFNLPMVISDIIGISVAAILFGLFIWRMHFHKRVVQPEDKQVEQA